MADLRASIAAIHYHASRPSIDKVALFAQMESIAKECESCIPELARLRPSNAALCDLRGEKD